MPRSTRGAWRAPTGASRRAPERPRQAQLPGLDDASLREASDEDILLDPAPTRRTPRRRNVPRASAGADVREFAAARRHLPSTRAGWVMLALITAALLAVVLAAGLLFRRYLLRDVHFRLDASSQIASLPASIHAQSDHAAQVTRDEMLSVFGQDIGRNIFLVPLVQRRSQLESIPWVQHATVMRILPDQILVHIVERTPIAFAREGDNVELVDADGVLLPISPARMALHHYSFPVVTGLHVHPAMASPQERMALYQRFLADLDHAQPHASSQVSEIDLSDPDDLRATLSSKGADLLIHFGADNFAARYQMYLAHIAEWQSRYPNLIGIDLRFPGDVPLELAPNPSTANSAADAKTTPEAASHASAASARKPSHAIRATAKAASLRHASSSTSAHRAQSLRRAEPHHQRLAAARHHHAPASHEKTHPSRVISTGGAQ